jgi:glycosyltransferase 2 family protein
MKPEAGSWVYRAFAAAFRGLLLYGSLAFLIYVAASNVRSLPEGAFSLRFALVIIALGNIYAVLLMLIAVAWGGFLWTLGVNASWREVILVYGRANLAKYLPGNIFQFAGRHVMGSDLRWSDHALLCSTALEILVIVLSAALVNLLLLTIFPLEEIPGTGPIAVVSAVIVTTLVTGTLLFIPARKFLPFRNFAEQITAVLYSRAPAIAVLLYMVFFFTLGEMTVATFYGINGRWVWRLWQQFTVAYTAAWLIGYVTPGAPGGVGVREAALVVLLRPSLGEAAALSVAAGLRFLTMLGDLLLFAACHCRTWSPRTSRASFREDPGSRKDCDR